MSVHYEWQIRHTEHDFFEAAEKLSTFTSDAIRMMLTTVRISGGEVLRAKANPDGSPTANGNFEIVEGVDIPGELTLVRLGGRDAANWPRGEAEVGNKCELPTIFDSGHKVPKRFQAELTKWKRGGFR